YLWTRLLPCPSLFPYTTLFRSAAFDPALVPRAAARALTDRAALLQLAPREFRNQGAFVMATVTFPPELGGSGVTISDDGNPTTGDRKSTRLNSSHVKISYAVFC